MDEAFARALAEWSGFYTLLGGAAATLLGLLFVALSLRLNVFRAQALADVRDFATLTFVTFVAAIVIAALALAPHAHGRTLAIVAGLVGGVGLLLLAWVGRVWIRLDIHHAGPQRGPVQNPKQLLAALLVLGSPFLGLLVAAGLVATRQPQALGWLAVMEGGLLVNATVAAWIVLAHAGPNADAGAPEVP